MPIASKWLKLQTSNLTHIFSGTIRTTPKKFCKRARGQGHMTPKFWGLNANSSKMVEVKDFKFDRHLLMDKTDMTPQIFFQKGAWPWSRGP